jgi:hypothetical protein
MLIDQTALHLYLGSPRELMIYATNTNTLTKQDPSAPGVILAASPNSSQLLINDQVRGLFYLYNTTSGVSQTQSGLGAAAAWTPDSSTLYIVDSSSLGANHTDTLYVYTNNSGWSSYPLAASPSFWKANSPPIGRQLAITVPGIGAYLSGNPTVAHTWCPSGEVGNNGSILFYPQSDSVPDETEVLGATSDGKHILGAELSGSSINLTDIGLDIPPTQQFPSAQCPETVSGSVQTLSPLSTNPSLNGTASLTEISNAAAVNQVVTGAAPTTASVTTAAPIAFVTYTPVTNSTAAAQLPYYLPQSTPGSVGPVDYVPFCQEVTPTPTCATGIPATPPTAPLFGAFSPDDNIFFVSTSGDDIIHFISIPTNVSPTRTPADTQQFSPNLPGCDPSADAGCTFTGTPGTIVPATAIAVKPRAVT